MAKCALVYLIFLNIFLLEASESSSFTCKTYSKYEKRVNCGKNGYLVKYGYKNCLKFYQKEIFDRFDDLGKNFITCTRDCLLLDLENIIEDEEKQKEKHEAKKIDCDDLRKKAFESHVNCYLKCNFCQICKTNKWALFEAYDLRDFMSTLAMKQVFKILHKCGPFSCFNFVTYFFHFPGLFIG